MKKGFILFCAAALSVPMSALAGVNVNVNLGVPAPVVVAPMPPVVVPPPPTVVFERPPLFLAPPRLGIYVGVGIPYDIVFADDYYYLNYHNGWYRSPSYNGPWVVIRQERLPLVVRRQSVEYIRVHRDREYQRYRHEHDRYRGRYFWGGREVRRGEPHRDRDDRRADYRDWKDERKRDEREWRDERRRDEKEWRDERKQERKEWKERNR